MSKKKKKNKPKFRKASDPLYEVTIKYSENSVTIKRFRLFLSMMEYYLDQHNKFFIDESCITSIFTGEVIHTYKNNW